MIIDAIFDKNITMQIFPEILEEYLYFFSQPHYEIIDAEQINSIFHLVLLLAASKTHLPDGDIFIDKKTRLHYCNIAAYIDDRKQKELEDGAVIPGLAEGFGNGGFRKWGQIEVPDAFLSLCNAATDFE